MQNDSAHRLNTDMWCSGQCDECPVEQKHECGKKDNDDTAEATSYHISGQQVGIQ